ncbi:beta-N-acetylglucosaminidase domain-containing protein, partial [Acinetobacter soli]|uniref:beta-N-acetylglucosaminidase domain-containing protein n=1 Tax=Acinetobacter soli TaxID=487316 RepID=UPI00281556DE
MSKDITKDDLKEFQQHLGSNISIWDNYPVNDGQKICDKIYTKPFNGRSSLNNECFLHAINPMLECSL